MKKKQREGSLNTEYTAKDIEIAINPISHKPPIGARNYNRFQVANLKIALTLQRNLL